MTAGRAIVAAALAGALGLALAIGLLREEAAGSILPAVNDAEPSASRTASPSRLRAAGPMLHVPAPPAPASASALERLPPEARPPRVDHGFVVDDTGAPVARAYILFRRRTTEGRLRRTRVPRRGAICTDARGRFEISPAADTMNEIYVKARRHEPLTSPWTPPPDDRPPTFTLQRMAVLEGGVRDAEGERAGYLDVSVYRHRSEDPQERRVAQTSTNSDGTWRFHVPEGRYLVSVSGRTAYLAEREVVAVRGAPARWDLALPAGTFARGRLVLPRELESMDTELALYTSRRDRVAIDVRDGEQDTAMPAGGARDFRLQVPPGDAPYWLVVRDQNGSKLPVWVGGPYRGARHAWNLVVPDAAARPGAVRGTTWIVEPLEDDEDDDSEAEHDGSDDEDALAQARRTTYYLRLEDARGFHATEQVYGGAARFRFEDVPAGAYTLRVLTYGDRELLRQTVNVERGQVVDLPPLVVR